MKKAQTGAFIADGQQAANIAMDSNPAYMTTRSEERHSYTVTAVHPKIEHQIC